MNLILCEKGVWNSQIDITAARWIYPGTQLQKMPESKPPSEAKAQAPPPNNTISTIAATCPQFTRNTIAKSALGIHKMRYSSASSAHKPYLLANKPSTVRHRLANNTPDLQALFPIHHFFIRTTPSTSTAQRNPHPSSQLPLFSPTSSHHTYI